MLRGLRAGKARKRGKEGGIRGGGQFGSQNIVQTICPIESSKTDDTSSDDGNIASGEDNGGGARASMKNSNCELITMHYFFHSWKCV